MFKEAAQKIGKIGPEEFGFHLEFFHEPGVSRVDAGRRYEHFPHARPRRVQAEVYFRIQIEHDGFPVHVPHKYMLGNNYAIGELHLPVILLDSAREQRRASGRAQ